MEDLDLDPEVNDSCCQEGGWPQLSQQCPPTQSSILSPPRHLHLSWMRTPWMHGGSGSRSGMKDSAPPPPSDTPVVDAHAVVALIFVLEAAQDLDGVDDRGLANQHLAGDNPGEKAGQ